MPCWFTPFIHLILIFIILHMSSRHTVCHFWYDNNR
nr:MAG TPA: hypothetical protein [Caudoviricetes sp.]